MTPITESTPTPQSSKSIEAIAKKAGIDISKFPIDQLRMGLKVEQEHNGGKGSDVDVVPGNDMTAVLKIAIAHLRESPTYYTDLKKMEKEADAKKKAKAESLARIKALIAERTITADDLNNFIMESLPKSNDERLARYTRSQKQYHMRHPGKQVDDKTDREGNNDPTKTLRGKLSVGRQARDNKRHPERFIEAVQFIKSNQWRPIEECVEGLDKLQDKTALLALISKLLGKSGIHINKDWLQQIQTLAGAHD